MVTISSTDLKARATISPNVAFKWFKKLNIERLLNACNKLVNYVTVH